MRDMQKSPLFWLAFTLIFIGYFFVWMPGPAAGLQLMGIELGEWIKFLGMDTRRNWFYLPPLTLGFMMATITLSWPKYRWQTWGWRGLAVAVSLLAFPAIEDITGVTKQEYYFRVIGIGVVCTMTFLTTINVLWGDVFRQQLLKASLLMVVALVGLIFPTWAYALARAAATTWLQFPLDIGMGVLLNLAGHTLVFGLAGHQLWSTFFASSSH